MNLDGCGPGNVLWTKKETELLVATITSNFNDEEKIDWNFIALHLKKTPQVGTGLKHKLNAPRSVRPGLLAFWNYVPQCPKLQRRNAEGGRQLK